MGEWLSLRGLAQVNKTDLKVSVIMILLISHVWIHPHIAQLTKIRNWMPPPKDPTRIVVYSHRRLQDENNETLKVIDTCSQIKVIQQSWKTSMSGWWQKAQLVWIWTEHKSSRILTSWWHHQWANFLAGLKDIFRHHHHHHHHHRRHRVDHHRHLEVIFEIIGRFEGASGAACTTSWTW